MQKSVTKVKRSPKTSSSETLSKAIIEGMIDKKGHEIAVLDLRLIKGAIADFFVICTGNSDTHVEAISESIEEMVYKATSQEPWHREGKVTREWILLDYVDVVASVFKSGTRKYYSLEQLWGDALITWVNPE